jgi:hypothetical protein
MPKNLSVRRMAAAGVDARAKQHAGDARDPRIYLFAAKRDIDEVRV